MLEVAAFVVNNQRKKRCTNLDDDIMIEAM
jgi:hypothetical protein